ncbi:hypothetical protein [Cellulomonas chitinilytica]|uniref:hypothetical protein n=1 Tax=Cellulomonas chitinilytica TaxID=398759 RepID=UPI001945A8EC|nr:hypothetical protein [Cellulomonas chitinilytica]
MRPRTAVALVAVAVVGLLSTSGCSAGTGSPSASSSARPATAPTGPPSDLTPATADGDEQSIGSVATVTVPEGTTSEPGTVDVEGAEQVLLRLPDGDEQGLPALQVTWQEDAAAGVLEQSWSTENLKKADQSVHDYVRSPVEWPGSDESVVSTWTETVPLAAGGTVEVDALSLMVGSDDGAVVYAIAFAPAGELDSSTSLAALRTLTLS